jgi:hypothetical protein
MSGVDQYDKLIPSFGTSGKKWPQMRLFLNMVKDNYEKTGSVRFEARKYDEVDSRSYKGATAADGTVSSQFACFLNEFLQLVDNETISTVAPPQTYRTAATGNFGPAADTRADTSTIGLSSGIVGGSLSADKVLSAVKDAEPQFFKEFMSAITTGRFDAIDNTFTFKNRRDIVRDLAIQNLFTGLVGTGAGDLRSPSPRSSRVGRTAGVGVAVTEAGFGVARGEMQPARDPVDADLFLTEYAVGNRDRDCQSYAGAGIPISFKWDKYVLGHLLKSALKSASTRTSTFFNIGAAPTGPLENAYYRKVGDTKNLYTLINGKETAVQIGSDQAKNIKMGQNCYDLGMRSNDAGTQAKCYDLIKNCLAGDNIERCKEFMKTSNYWTTVKNDVDKLNLDLARELLDSFGYPIMTEDNKEVGRKLKVYGNSTQWLKYLSETKFKNTSFGAREIKQIAANTKLTGYLDLVAAKLNRNPGVLNPDYAKDAPASTGSAFNGSTLQKYGLSGKFVQPASGVSTSSVIAMQNAMLRKRNALAIYYGVPLNTVGFVMRGGGAAVQQFEDLQNNSMLPLRLSSMVEEHYKTFVNNLKASNKDLDTKDKTDIEKLIGELKVLEDKLFKAAIYTSKYQDLVSVFGEEDTQSLITLDHLQQFVDKRNNYFVRTGKKQDALTAILQALSGAVQKETKTVSMDASKYPTSPVKQN